MRSQDTIMRRTLFSSIVMAACVPCFADTPAIPDAYIATGDGGHYYFKMVPCGRNHWDFSCATGAVYEVSDRDPGRLVWSTSGWFAYMTYLSYDGRYLVRMGNWPTGCEPSADHLAIAFYDGGKLLRQYSTKELIRDVSKVPCSVSHYDYLHEVQGFYRNTTNFFTIVMIDGTEYTFDVSNGEALPWGDKAADAPRMKWVVIVVTLSLAVLAILVAYLRSTRGRRKCTATTE